MKTVEELLAGLKYAIEENSDLIRQLRDNHGLFATLLLAGAISSGKALGTEEAIRAAVDSAQRIIESAERMRIKRNAPKKGDPESGVNLNGPPNYEID